MTLRLAALAQGRPSMRDFLAIVRSRAVVLLSGVLHAPFYFYVSYALLRYLQGRGLLKYHKVEARTSRGFLFDGRYPHWTAVIRAPDGVKWVVDSWYAPMGGIPDISPLSDWKPRGLLSSGALD